MTENEFRIEYSRLIEYYQYIEMRMKFMCAGFLADEEKGWYERIFDYDSDPFGVLIQNIRKLQKETHNILLSDKDLAKLDEIREKRNYWIHQCFGGMNPIIFYEGRLRHQGYAKKLLDDLNEAIEWDAKFVEIARATEIKNK